MKIRLDDGLPYVTVILFHDGQQVKLEKVLLDTGSASTVFSADKVLEIGLKLERNDVVHRIRGVGGTEFVFGKQVEELQQFPLWWKAPPQSPPLGGKQGCSPPGGGS